MIPTFWILLCLTLPKHWQMYHDFQQNKHQNHQPLCPRSRLSYWWSRILKYLVQSYMIMPRKFFFLGKQQTVVTVIVAQFLISAAVLKVVKEAPAAVCFTCYLDATWWRIIGCHPWNQFSWRHLHKNVKLFRIKTLSNQLNWVWVESHHICFQGMINFSHSLGNYPGLFLKCKHTRYDFNYHLVKQGFHCSDFPSRYFAILTNLKIRLFLAGYLKETNNKHTCCCALSSTAAGAIW